MAEQFLNIFPYLFILLIFANTITLLMDVLSLPLISLQIIGTVFQNYQWKKLHT